MIPMQISRPLIIKIEAMIFFDCNVSNINNKYEKRVDILVPSSPVHNAPKENRIIVNGNDQYNSNGRNQSNGSHTRRFKITNKTSIDLNESTTNASISNQNSKIRKVDFETTLFAVFSIKT